MAYEKKTVGKTMDKNVKTVESSGTRRARKDAGEGKKMEKPVVQRATVRKIAPVKAPVVKTTGKEAVALKPSDVEGKPKAKRLSAKKEVGNAANGVATVLDAQKIKMAAEGSVRTTLAPQAAWPFPLGKKP
ncbi:hypothetical protein [Allofranklinella schreckenbergeri]|uniref:hypothetical protein n=1 Tax=Allofranklinella schreckenbergeri TaxID=1076744 RepID=UPI0011C3A51F|nr:hypothetical protein [Allofranklinella schreckenbergeri]MDO4706413.1 hypothetical protein [Comamonadaceae bacterium]